MELKGLNIGIGLCGSFCTLKNVIEEISELVKCGCNVIPIMSAAVQNTDTRFGSADFFKEQLKNITGNDIITTIADAEPIGPKKLLDLMLIAPCTGNTLAKLNNGITDSPVLMAAKAHLRNNLPLLIAIASNDALGTNFYNIGELMNKKNIYFVPFGQDDFKGKPKSMIAKFEQIIPAIESAMDNTQLQPVIVSV